MRRLAWVALAAAVMVGCHKGARKARRGNTVDVLAWTRDLEIGRIITASDVKAVTVPRSLLQEMDGILAATPMDLSTVDGADVDRQVRRGDFVRYSDLLDLPPAPSESVAPGRVAVTLPVDPAHGPGSLLRAHDSVNLIGLLSIGGRPAKAYTLITNVRVITAPGAEPPRHQRVGPRPDSIAVEVTPKVAEQLADLMPRLRSKALWVVLRNPRDTPGSLDGKINPEILPALAEPLPEPE